MKGIEKLNVTKRVEKRREIRESLEEKQREKNSLLIDCGNKIGKDLAIR